MWRSFGLVLVLCLLGACTKVQPIYNVEEAIIVTGSGKTPTTEEVRTAISRAVVAKTWKIDEIDDQRVEAHLVKGKKIARLTVIYSTKKYSIRYRNSVSLLYEAGRIHRRYNSWVRGLEITINRNLAQL